MVEDNNGAEASTNGTDRPLTRRSTVFEKPPGNVYVVAGDGGSPLEDVSQRPQIVAPVTRIETNEGSQRSQDAHGSPTDS